VPSERGPQADLVLVEPNGDEHYVRCLCEPHRTEIGGDRVSLTYLNDRYTRDVVGETARECTLAL